MFSRLMALRERDERGFTLIELLVVILIIAILAAIAIPVFLNQRKKGYVSQMEAAVKNAATAAESYATGTTGGNYAALNATGLSTEGWKYAGGISTITVNTTADNQKYCISVAHTSLDAAKIMAISSDVTTPTETGAHCVAGVFTPSAPAWTP